jgi:hypothetical protein
MGFTRYWRVNSAVDPVRLSAAAQDMARIVAAGEALGISLAGPDGDPGTSPKLGEDVVFNGAGQAALEAFSWPPDFQELNARGWSTDFCKTNGQPYDTVVAACLLAAKRRLEDGICLNSDIGPEDWGAGQDLYRDALGEEPPVPRTPEEWERCEREAEQAEAFDPTVLESPWEGDTAEAAHHGVEGIAVGNISRDLQRKLAEAIGQSVETVEHILNEHDPLEISATSPDQYGLATQTVVVAMTTCHSQSDVVTVLRKEFADQLDAGRVSEAKIRDLASDLWRFWTTGRDPTAFPHQD